LRLDIAQQLADWKAEQGVDEQSKVFGNLRVNKAAKMLRKDLETAGIAYKDGAGRVADFHSLRHTFISNLSKSGASPKIAQSLARHSTIGLTMDTYTHIGLYDERAALDSLPVLPSLDENKNDESKAAALKTGTDDMSVGIDKSAYKPAYKKLTKNAFSGIDRSSLVGIEQEKKQESAESSKSLETALLGNESNQLSPPDTGEKNRRRPDSNRRITVLQTVALGLLATPPTQKKRPITVHERRPFCNKIRSFCFSGANSLQQFCSPKRLLLCRRPILRRENCYMPFSITTVIF